MESFIVEDVNELLKLKKGDPNRLNHIKERCLANEIISISDRKYIERLCSQYLQKPEIEKPKKQEYIEPSKNFLETPVQEPSVDSLKEPIQIKEVQALEKEEKLPSRPLGFIENKKILFAAGAIVLGLVLIAVVAIEYDGLLPESNQVINNTLVEGLSLETDNSAYQTADIISISGQVSIPLGAINVSIENVGGETIWEESLNVKESGEFSTLLIAGGEGWENSGMYTLKAESNDESAQISFEFTAN